MNAKRFVAVDMRRALERVRVELGADAIILSSQRTARGVEIVASTGALEAAPAEPPRIPNTDLQWPLSSDHGVETDNAELPSFLELEWERSCRRSVPPARPPAAQAAAIPQATLAALTAADLAGARQPLDGPAERAPAPRSPAAEIAPPASMTGPAPWPKSAPEPTSNAVRLDRQMQGLAERMQAQAGGAGNDAISPLEQLQNEMADMRLFMERHLASAVAAPASSPLNNPLQDKLQQLGLPAALARRLTLAVGSHTDSPDKAWRGALAALAHELPVDASDPVGEGGIFAFVGPTGVGKTTTIAKLAARYVIDHGIGQVAIVTTDTYRVGAHDQLRALGRILNVPVRVVDEERKLPQTLESLKRFPLVLIDTAGFRQGDPLLKQQETLLAACPGVERILVLACNSQIQTLKASMHAYSQLPLRGCVVTKLDECESLGEALSVLEGRDVSVLYGADGQDIPATLPPPVARRWLPVQ